MSDDLERRLKEFPAQFPRPDERVTRRVASGIRGAMGRRRARGTLALAAALLASLGAGAAIGSVATPASAVDAATFKSVDATMICTTVSVFGSREITVGVSPRAVTPSGDLPAVLRVTTGGATTTATFVSVDARGTSGRLAGGIYLNRVRCSMTEARIPAAPKGLPGPPIEWGKELECGATRRVVVRVRGTLLSPGPWRIFGSRREFRGIRRDVRSTAVMVSTWPGRKPLALVTLDSAQGTKLWSAPRCG